MLLAIDIGNSNISVGLFDKAGKLLFLSPSTPTAAKRRIRSAST